ncbi:MAG: glycosyltransferase family 2 protein [Solirubrobacteraceae bacterium]
MKGRPTVSVIVPFAGTSQDLERLVAALQSLALTAGDELIIADNRLHPSAAGTTQIERGAIRVCRAGGVRAAGFARNRGAELATGTWLVFIDADTQPTTTLVDDYFLPWPAAATAVLAGGIVDVAKGSSRAARHTEQRRQMAQRVTLDRKGAPYAQTANCAVRRCAFARLGGFNERIRFGEDADLCFRLWRDGWQLEERPAARVRHDSRDTLCALLRQLAHHGTGAAWLNRHYPGQFPSPSPRELAGRVARRGWGAARPLIRGELDAAEMELLDLLTESAFDLGRLLSNKARWRRPRDGRWRA